MCRILIIGSGIAGLSTAYHLGKRDVTSVRVIEKEPTIAAHASGRNSGMIHHYHPDRSMRENLAWSIRMLKLYHIRNPDHDFYRDAPSLWLFPDEVKQDLIKDQEVFGNWRRVSSPDVPDVLTPEEVPEDAIWIRFDDDGLIEPGMLASALRRDLSGMDIDVQTGTSLTDGTREDGNWHLETNDEPIRADVVVNAAGAWADPVGSALGASPKQFTPETRYLFYTEERLLDDVEYGFFWDQVHSTYLRSFNEGTLICAGDSTPAEPGGVPDDIHPTDLLADRLIDDFPQLGSIEIAEHWACQRTFRPDRLPYIEQAPEQDGLIWSAGLGGHGMTGSMWVGQETADLVQASR